MEGILFSIITPSTGLRPKALQKAVDSVEQAARFAGLEKGQLEILIGFDGVKGRVPTSVYPVRSFNLPIDNDWGNGIRNMLLKIAGGDKLIFLDDDNVLKPHALRTYLKHFDAEMIIGRIDTQLAFDKPFLPVEDAGSLVRQGNIDPLCLCVSRRLVVDRCNGWDYPGKYEADYLNILNWHRKAHSMTVIEEIVGIYDAGRNLDHNALSRRQQNLLDRLAGERSMVPASKDYNSSAPLREVTP
ncbi:glycosyltransferase family 2 protein [Pseudodesulfovibrio piezophilus]|uniref:Glycosyl transferase, group 2 family protein n=1 Tax=Pseudodesulfovibrio piezophilus (strain DSM 21447 / JCM 15486 / C1TLV30) TaxID=1322246 RepID=M1WKR3_PSEP2|nr:glycosyltransferase family A protein [Pseudodesulfovibrio piezophilus]CCH50051.1 Glycosyl transferase, group 2 family protein [Pseudodesulfovibrio piezophilus C1TLV30]